MDIPGFLASFKEYGLLGLMCLAVISVLFKVLMWTYSEVKENRIQQAKERELWATSNKEFREIIQSLNLAVKEHENNSAERSRYVREEHKEMITILGRINGYKHD